MSLTSFEIVSGSPAQTTAIGAALAAWLEPGDVLLLHGDLGAGKTTFTKGIAEALGVDAVVSSPSFSLVNEYDAGRDAPVTRLYHLDLYRLQGEDDLASIGFNDFAGPEDGITVIEWPERAAAMLPDRYLLIEIEMTGADRRNLRFVPFAHDDLWEKRFANLRDRVEASVR